MLLLHPRPAPRCAGRAGYPSWFLVVLVVVAVAHRRLGPNSSATTSTVDQGAAILSGPAPLLQPAHDHSAASAHDESHLIRTA